MQVAASRKLDTALLRKYANENLLRFPADAVKYGLIDALKYDDEIRDEIAQKIGVSRVDKINFISLGKYAEAVSYKQRGGEKIAVIYAAGDIIDGKGERGQIGSESYRTLIRNARLDNSIKAIVLRINSGGGSSLASENIWRELVLARKAKPLIVSFGDVAASGGYYIACPADSIFAQPNTITGSIGVFSILPNMQNFFNDKLGVTFDVVKTGPDADALSVTQPLTEMQKQYLQNDVDSIYHTFKTRVAEGRKMNIEFDDSIGQGRVWSGSRALKLGLVDRIGTLQDAISAAGRMAKLKEFSLREYPEPQNVFDMIFGNYKESTRAAAIKEELGEQGAKTYSTLKRVQQVMGVTQARMPFDFVISDGGFK